MPMYKKRRITKSKPRAKKVSYAMVPRPLLNREKGHRHVITCSTSPQEALLVANTAGGVSTFSGGGRSSSNMSVTFSLSEVIIRLGGLTAITLNPPGFNELVNLYDTFQIEKVEMSIWSGCTESSTGAGNTFTYTMPLIGHTVDMDDANNTSITNLQQYSTYRCSQLGQSVPLKSTFVPCVAGDVVSGQSRLQRQDVSTGFPNTPHYGYKLCVDGLHATLDTNTTLLSVQFRLHYLMKSTR